MVSEAGAAQPSGRDVLDDLDSRIPATFYWYLAVLACIGGFLFGYDTSNIGSALGFIPYHLSSLATGFLVAGASLGAAAGAIVAGPLTDHFGRRALLITDAAIYAAGAKEADSAACPARRPRRIPARSDLATLAR